MTEVYWYPYTLHSSFAVKAIKMSSSDRHNLKISSIHVKKYLDIKIGATKWITESFSKQENKKKTKQKPLCSQFV